MYRLKSLPKECPVSQSVPLEWKRKEVRSDGKIEPSQGTVSFLKAFLVIGIEAHARFSTVLIFFSSGAASKNINHLQAERQSTYSISIWSLMPANVS